MAKAKVVVLPPLTGPTPIDSLLVPDLKLRSTSATNAKQLERRLSYLWQSAHALLPSNARMAHELTCVWFHNEGDPTVLWCVLTPLAYGHAARPRCN